MPHSQPCKSRSSRMHTMKWEGARGRRGKQTPPLKGTPSDPPYRLIIKDFPIPTQTTTLASPSLKNDLFQVCTCVRTICFEIWKSGNISLRARRIKISYFLKQNNRYYIIPSISKIRQTNSSCCCSSKRTSKHVLKIVILIRSIFSFLLQKI